MQLRNKREQVQPRKIRKHSDVVKETGGLASQMFGSPREKTEYGFRVPGFAGKAFETHLEVMLPGTSTDTLLHASKDKVIRVISGTAVVVLGAPGESQELQVSPGQEAHLLRDVPYRIATLGVASLELLVVVGSKYDAGVQVLSKDGVSASEVPASLLAAPQQAPQGSTYRAGSKAKEQLAAQARTRRSAQVVPTNSPPPERFGAVGMNPKPSNGHFDDSGAG